MGDPDADNAAQERSRTLARSLYGLDICGTFRTRPDDLTPAHVIDDWPCVVRSGHLDDHIDAGADEWPRTE